LFLKKSNIIFETLSFNFFREAFMANLFDYVAWRGDISFDTIPFNKLDALLLSHISYSLLGGLVSENFEQAKSLSQLAKDFKASPDYDERTKIGFLINKKTTELLLKAAKAPRGAF